MYKNIDGLTKDVSSLSFEAGHSKVSGGCQIPPGLTDRLVRNYVFNPDKQVAKRCYELILEIGSRCGTYPASVQKLYEAAGKGFYSNKTVPAINLRGLTYDSARAVFRSAISNKAGAFIFEIARSEIGYTQQTPEEYSACVLGAAIREGFSGPVFLQGDHYQVNARRYAEEPEAELNALKALISDSVKAHFYNIDIDASTLVDITKPSLSEQQSLNCRVTAEMTGFIRDIQPPGTVISIGAEIGEVGKRNSTVEELDAFMSGYLGTLGSAITGISKISVQTGTKHGGVVLPDGSIAEVQVDFETLRKLSQFAREKYKLAGAVQHGASTLPDEAFDRFPKTGTAEIHLATGFQNIIYDSEYFPGELRERIYRYAREHFTGFGKTGETDEQFLYENRKRAFGPFKQELWDLPEENRAGIREALEKRFTLLFHKLNVVNTVDLVNRFIVRA